GALSLETLCAYFGACEALLVFFLAQTWPARGRPALGRPLHPAVQLCAMRTFALPLPRVGHALVGPCGQARRPGENHVPGPVPLRSPGARSPPPRPRPKPHTRSRAHTGTPGSPNGRRGRRCVPGSPGTRWSV